MINLKEKQVSMGKGDVLLSPKQKRLVLQNIKRKKGQPLDKAERLDGNLTLQFDTLTSLETFIETLEQMKGHF